MLIESGVNLNTTTFDGNTALIIASNLGYIDIVNLLIEVDVDLNLINNNGNTAEKIAKNMGYTEIENIFIKKEENER